MTLFFNINGYHEEEIAAFPRSMFKRIDESCFSSLECILHFEDIDCFWKEDMWFITFYNLLAEEDAAIKLILVNWLLSFVCIIHRLHVLNLHCY